MSLFRRLVKKIEVPDEQTDPNETHQWSNFDLAPTPKHERIWGSTTFAAFWCAHAAGAGSWTAGSSVIALGLDPVVAYHIGFPVFSRTAYGMWGSYMAVGMRAVGVNAWYASRCVWVGICAIWPQWRTLPNALPASASITSTQAASFFMFMLVQQGMTFFHARDLKYFYHVKSITVFITFHGILIWFMVKTGGARISEFVSTPMSHDSYLWLAARSFNAGLGAASSLTVNQGDMTRYATKPRDAIWSTMIMYPLASALPCLYGILVAAAAKNMTGKAVWNMWDALDLILRQYDDNRGARFLVAMAAFFIALSYLGVNLATNCLPFGSDLSALFPRWFTIRRGQFLCSLLGVAIVPWKLLTSAAKFITFLSGYGYWLAPIAGILFADYWLISKGNIDISQIYTSNPLGRYWYARGWNWRAVVTTILSLLPCLPGFAQQIASGPLPGLSKIGTNLFYVSFVLTYTLAITLYLSLSYLFPRKYIAEHDLKSQRFEQLADEGDARERDDEILALGEDGSLGGGAAMDKTESKSEVEGIAYVEPAQVELR
ncbi:uncharacterized protein JCM10292_004024 [Rhodotorula paludigena]|uniref:uncharacterized protein n=1 Tax=Rhodotorula paludigena TaxID=86838 RepID=UPI00317666BD